MLANPPRGSGASPFVAFANNCGATRISRATLPHCRSYSSPSRPEGSGASSSFHADPLCGPSVCVDSAPRSSAQLLLTDNLLSRFDALCPAESICRKIDFIPADRVDHCSETKAGPVTFFKETTALALLSIQIDGIPWQLG